MTEPDPPGRWVGYVTHDGRHWGVLDRYNDNLHPLYVMSVSMSSFHDREEAGAWVNSQRGEAVTEAGKEYRRMPDTYPSKEEREFDRRLIMTLMEAMPDSIDVPSAMWAAAEIILTRRRAISAQGLAAGADREATQGTGQDPAQIPV
jgi:hypothetical protein